jgi:NAD(P)-dependent dehydrogenase (short-subunit alcohol dehydrogenase family)
MIDRHRCGDDGRAVPVAASMISSRALSLYRFIGHFALTTWLRPWLCRADDARVVSVASSGNLFGPILWDDPDFRFISYDPLLAYAQSKPACILMSVAIARKWHADGITSNALNRKRSLSTGSVRA